MTIFSENKKISHKQAGFMKVSSASDHFSQVSKMANKGTPMSMFEHLNSIGQLEEALEQGLVSLHYRDGRTGEVGHLLITTCLKMIKHGSVNDEHVDDFTRAKDEAPLDSIIVFDMVNKRVVEFSSGIFEGIARRIGTINPYAGKFRSQNLNLKRDDLVIVDGPKLVTFSGTIARVNPDSLEHRFVVMLGEEHQYKTMVFHESGTSLDKQFEIRRDFESEDAAWVDSEGYEYYPAIDLAKQGYQGPRPLIFVMFDNEGVEKIVAISREGFDLNGNKVLTPIAVNTRAVEVEQYLFGNASDLLLLSKEALDGLSGSEGDFVMPVLAYYKGLNIVHITLPVSN
ncbi:hypothetical protein ACI2KR_08425 [Pseudomonas luteola]